MAAVEQLWHWAEANHPWLLGPWGLLLVHEVTYIGTFLPYFIADYIPSLRKYKLQPDKTAEPWKLWQCIKFIIFLHFGVEFPMIYFSHPLMKWLGIQKTYPFPAWYTHAWQIVVFFFMEDFYFYWIHRFLHWDKIYAKIHKVHHLYAAPFGIAAEYAHPVETLFLGIGTAAPPIIFSFFGMHTSTLYIWLAVRVIQTVDVHSGYDFPWNPMRYVPFWGGAKFHDYHHMAFNSNFSSTFTIWDNVFGTTERYYPYWEAGGPWAKKKNAAVAAASGKSIKASTVDSTTKAKAKKST